MIRFWRDRLTSVLLAAIVAVMSVFSPKMVLASGTGFNTAFIGHNSLPATDPGSLQQVAEEEIVAPFQSELFDKAASPLTIARSPAAKSTVEVFVVSSLAKQVFMSMKGTNSAAMAADNREFMRNNTSSMPINHVGGAALPTGGKPDHMAT